MQSGCSHDRPHMKTYFMDHINRRYYSTPQVVERYASEHSLRPVESALVSMLASRIENRPVLDLGVGTGRTTGALAAMTRYYVGLDYSEQMLRACRRNHRDCNVLLCDARRLCFRESSFEMACFFFNAIDDVNAADRLQILREIYRVLEPGGTFVFSGHNLDYRWKSAWRFAGFAKEESWRETLQENAGRVFRYFLGMRNHLRMRKHEEHTPSYSIVNDPCHTYRLLTYYMTREQQVAQLEQMGFDNVQAFDGQGRRLDESDRCTEGSLHYVARKPG